MSRATPLRPTYESGFSEENFKRRVMEDEPGDGLVTIRASDVAMEGVDWLWPGRFPMGKVSVLAGEGGLSKSMLLCWIAATVSVGGAWPNNEGRSRIGSTIILSAEDDPSDTVVPRLVAAGADTSKIHLVSSVRDKGHRRTFSLRGDLQKVEDLIASIGDVSTLILDPVTSYLGKVDSHNNSDVRSVLEPLGEMAARKRVAIICNNHLNKTGGGNAAGRVMGSVAFTAQARGVTIVSKSPDDDDVRLFLPTKMNVALLAASLAYRIETVPVSLMGDHEIEVPRIVWEQGTVNITADEALQAASDDIEGRGAKSDAIDFLLSELQYGRVEASEVFKEGRKAGHSERTLKRAKAELKIKTTKDGRIWYWSLPGEPNENAPKAGCADEFKGAKPHQGGQPQDPWPPSHNPSVTAGNEGKTPPDTTKGANSLSVAPLAPLAGGDTDSAHENDTQNKWRTQI